MVHTGSVVKVIKSKKGVVYGFISVDDEDGSVVYFGSDKSREKGFDVKER